MFIGVCFIVYLLGVCIGCLTGCLGWLCLYFFILFSLFDNLIDCIVVCLVVLVLQCHFVVVDFSTHGVGIILLLLMLDLLNWVFVSAMVCLPTDCLGLVGFMIVVYHLALWSLLAC